MKMQPGLGFGLDAQNTQPASLELPSGYWPHATRTMNYGRVKALYSICQRCLHCFWMVAASTSYSLVDLSTMHSEDGIHPTTTH